MIFNYNFKMIEIPFLISKPPRVPLNSLSLCRIILLLLCLQSYLFIHSANTDCLKCARHCFKSQGIALNETYRNPTFREQTSTV